MMDIDLLVTMLRKHGHTVTNVIRVPDNAGMYEFEIDGHLHSLAEVQLMLENDQHEHDADSPTQATA
jgi:hypothetical protein